MHRKLKNMENQKSNVRDFFRIRKKHSRIKFLGGFRENKLSRFTDLKFPKEFVFARKIKNGEMAKISALKVYYGLFSYINNIVLTLYSVMYSVFP